MVSAFAFASNGPGSSSLFQALIGSKKRESERKNEGGFSLVLDYGEPGTG